MTLVNLSYFQETPETGNKEVEGRPTAESGVTAGPYSLTALTGNVRALNGQNGPNNVVEGSGMAGIEIEAEEGVVGSGVIGR